MGCFRPVPAQTGHGKRMNATPSGLPFKSTGFAIYPVPPQFGQSSEFTPLPLRVISILLDLIEKFAVKRFVLRITNKNPLCGRIEPVPAQTPLNKRVVN